MAKKAKKVWEPLPRAEVIKAVERKRPCRIPMVRAKWWGEGLDEQYGDRLKEFDRFPEDTRMLWIQPFDLKAMKLSWELPSGKAHDARCVIDDYAKLDEFAAKMTDPAKDPQFEKLIPAAEQIRKEGRYLLFGWWNLFFEKPWSLRGMQNLLEDYYVQPENVHRLHEVLCDQYCRYIERCVREFRPDGFWSSDDLGHQTQPMMSPKAFKELIKPYYARVGAAVRKHKVHFWLHSCGNNTPLLADLAETGVDVFHPVQKHTMDEKAVAEEFGGKLTFLAGIDVQHTLQEKDPAGVRKEVRFLIDTFDLPDGGMCMAAGNGIVRGTPFENIEAFLEEALVYGEKHRENFAGKG